MSVTVFLERLVFGHMIKFLKHLLILKISRLLMDQSTVMVPSFFISPKAKLNFWRYMNTYICLQFCCCCYGDGE